MARKYANVTEVSKHACGSDITKAKRLNEKRDPSA
uniref:Uncharacterized protein n=1 Tax=Rhizophora mucronata TaxID=61149 RepID=A0A2P2Q3Q8_RHIMU